MATDIILWRRNFESYLPRIKIQFDSFFLKQEVSEFYTLEEDPGNAGLILHIAADSRLPKQIEEALIRAFADSRPL